MHFPVVVYWCQYNWLSASLIKVLLESIFAAKNEKKKNTHKKNKLELSQLPSWEYYETPFFIPTWLLMRRLRFVCLHHSLRTWSRYQFFFFSCDFPLWLVRKIKFQILNVFYFCLFVCLCVENEESPCLGTIAVKKKQNKTICCCQYAPKPCRKTDTEWILLVMVHFYNLFSSTNLFHNPYLFSSSFFFQRATNSFICWLFWWENIQS